MCEGEQKPRAKNHILPYNTMTSKTEPKRGRGRPANFPGVKTIAVLYSLPVETAEMVKAIAAKREQPIGIVVNTMIEQSFKRMSR